MLTGSSVYVHRNGAFERVNESLPRIVNPARRFYIRRALPIDTPRGFNALRRVYLEEQLVVLAVDARLGHPDPLLLVHLVAEVRQVDGVKIRALQKGVQAVLGAQVSLLLRRGKKTRNIERGGDLRARSRRGASTPN